MNGFTSADMSTAAANGFRDGLAAQPAAAQEAVAWQRRYKNDDVWFNISKHTYDETVGGKWAEKYDVRELYAAPGAAAPVVSVDSDAFDHLVDEVATEHGEMLDDGGPSGWSFTCEDLVAFAKHLMSDYKAVLVADAYAIARAEAKRDSTPAAPGIDLSEVPRYTLAHGDFESQMLEHSRGAWVRLSDVESALIDASPKSGNRGRYFCDGPGGHFFCDDLKLARDLVNAYDKDDDWTITDLQATSAEVGS